MRVAIVHDWLTGMRGGERCLEALLDVFPDAEIFTLVHVPGSVSERIEARRIHTSFIDRLPGAHAHYRRWLPLFPAAIERFELDGFDLVVSSSHCVAKGVRPPAGVPHLCYCHTPMRYVWDLYDDYFGPGRSSAPVRLAMRALAPRLRRWDAATATRVDAFVANSAHVRERIRRCYGRGASVVYPPVDVDRFAPAAEREDFYLVVAALAPYKRIDLALAAFERLDRPLVIVGDGPERERLRRAAGPNVRFTGWLPDAEVADYYARCRAFIFPAHEDFGITAVEAQAAGAPVIAYARGGALETVVDARSLPADRRSRATGIFFDSQTIDALVEAVLAFERREFDADALVANAARFRPEAFRRGIRERVDALLRPDRSRGPRARAQA